MSFLKKRLGGEGGMTVLAILTLVGVGIVVFIINSIWGHKWAGQVAARLKKPTAGAS